MRPGPSLARPILRCDARGRSQRLINHNCFNSINDVFRRCSCRAGTVGKRMNSLGYFIVMSGPARGRGRRATIFRALLPCLVLIALDAASGAGPDPHPRPVPSGPRRLRRAAGFAAAQERRQRRRPPTAMPAVIPTTGSARRGPAGAVADRPDPDLRPARRQRRLRLRLRLAQPHAQEAEILSGPGQAEAAARSRLAAARIAAGRTPPASCACRCRRPRPPTRRRCRRRWPAPSIGQPPRKRLKVDDDPFGAVGDYAGSFLIKSAVELSGGYDTNPGRLHRAARLAVLCGRAGISRGLRLGAPRAGRRPARLVHRLSATPFRRRSTARSRSAPTDIDRPDFTGHVDGRLDVSRRHPSDRAAAAAGRHRQSRQPEHPGRPCADIRSTRRSAAPSASTRISTACRFPPAPPSTAPSTPTPSSPTAARPPTTTATSTSMAASAASATICSRA